MMFQKYSRTQQVSITNNNVVLVRKDYLLSHLKKWIKKEGIKKWLHSRCRKACFKIFDCKKGADLATIGQDIKGADLAAHDIVFD